MKVDRHSNYRAAVVKSVKFGSVFELILQSEKVAFSDVKKILADRENLLWFSVVLDIQSKFQCVPSYVHPTVLKSGYLSYHNLPSQLKPIWPFCSDLSQVFLPSELPLIYSNKPI